MSINVLGFVTLPLTPDNYTVVAQGNEQYAVQISSGPQKGEWLSVQPNGTADTRPSNWSLGPYELAVLVSAGLRYTPITNASYLVAAIQA